MSTLLAFLFTIGVLVVVHEYGHYRVALWCGVRVLRFSVGFGRVLLRRQNAQGTEFTLSMLPLGGYVRMLDSRESPVPPDALHQAFDQQPLRARVAIVAAGPLANLLLAVVLYAAAAWWGVWEPKAVLSQPVAGSLAAQAGLQSGDWVQAWAAQTQPGADAGAADWQPLRSMPELRWALSQALLNGQALRLQVSDARGHHAREVSLPTDQLAGQEPDAGTWARIGLGAAFSEPVLGALTPDGPAAQAGLREGDKVLTLNAQPVPDAATLRERVRAAPEQRLSLSVERAGQVISLTLIPRKVEEKGEVRGRIDAIVGQKPESVLVSDALPQALWRGVERTADMVSLSLRMFGRMLVGQASLKNLSGPLTIADAAGQSAQQGLGYYLGFLAVVSVSLGVLNLLPVPMLDGGHLMCYLFEGATGRPVSEAWLLRLQRGGAVVLLLLMSIALSNDVARLLGLP
jgi:regulator of sigma E protease